MSKMLSRLLHATTLAACAACVYPAPAQNRIDTSAHTVQFVSVEPDVKLEVLDWGERDGP